MLGVRGASSPGYDVTWKPRDARFLQPQEEAVCGECAESEHSVPVTVRGVAVGDEGLSLTRLL